eukprot:3107691-Karenia_brevis.AAC.1
MTTNEGSHFSEPQIPTIKAPDYEGFQVSSPSNSDASTGLTLLSTQLSYMDATDMAIFATAKKQD